MTRTFEHWHELPLQAGARSLIEASAGTGKTWTIAALYLRLMLEGAGFSPRQVVVATFTNAAAAELRERLRRRLQEAEREALATGTGGSRDAVMDWLHARWQAEPALRDEDLRRLRLALAELDLAPIGTLHGLCARILRDQPFAAGSRFVQAQLVDGSEVVRELTLDLARLVQQSSEAELAARLSVAERAQLESLRIDDDLLKLLLTPALRIEPGVPPELPVGAAEVLRAATRDGMFRSDAIALRTWRTVAELLEAGRADEIDTTLIDALHLDGGLKGVLKAARGHADMLAAEAMSRELAEVLEARQAYARLGLFGKLRDWAMQRKQAWMQRRDRRSFDDLLLQVHDVLQAEAGAASKPLADALFAAWPVALVDEFQDTDGLQYAILDAIYRDGDGGPRGRLLMIGDPKQAIYRFRGGDIHTYLRASRAADDHLQLEVNQRSSTACVEAVNELFALTGPTLDVQEDEAAGAQIRYVRVRAAGRVERTPWRVRGEVVPRPLIIHCRSQPAHKQVGQARREALQACAAQIAAMLASGEQRIGDNPLQPGDIAVLLPANHDVLRLRRMLERRGVPCVSQSRQSVFHTDIARDLHIWLQAVRTPGSPRVLRGALLTRLGGFDLARLAALEQDGAAWQEQAGRFHAWHEDWRRRGLPAVIDALIASRGPALLAEDDGQRVLTDLRHLGELLQEKAESGLQDVELLGWFAAQRSASGSDDESAHEARQLRIESQESRVQLMTLHASKGLEFPIVFLPLMWLQKGRRESRSRPVTLHDDAAAGPCLRLDDEAREQDAREARAERFRLLYVALTRAVHACHLYVVPPADEEERKPADDLASSALELLLARIASPDALEQAQYIELQQGWHVPMGHYRAPDEEPAKREALPLPAPRSGPLPMRHSFSSLTRGLPAGDASLESAADDEAVQDDFPAAARSDEQAHRVLLELEKPAGAELGNALHEALELREVGLPVAEQHELLGRTLAAHGLLTGDERSAELLVRRWADRLDAALQTPLGDDLPALGDIPASDQLAEMEFHFALGESSLAALRAACIAHGEPGLVPPGERAIRGMMTGKIDLLFRHQGRIHVLDYKGNLLGTQLDDYRGAALDRALDRAHYRFQALLYMLALHRHLRLRLPGYRREHHLGDVHYVFLRALGLGPGVGHWRYRFDDGLLDAVDAALPAAPCEDAA
ncbi:UvrD-helicase domain-containing protein [Luteimonas sp. e5]